MPVAKYSRADAYAADAFARITGRPGVCDVTVGPGTTKLTDGLVESRNASVPVIAIVGELPRDWAPYQEMGVASQGFDQLRFLSSITKSTLKQYKHSTASSAHWPTTLRRPTDHSPLPSSTPFRCVGS